MRLVTTPFRPLIARAGPTAEVESINIAIGAQSAFSLQCKGFVRNYIPAIIKAVKAMPLDEVGAGPAPTWLPPPACSRTAHVGSGHLRTLPGSIANHGIRQSVHSLPLPKTRCAALLACVPWPQAAAA